MIRLGSLFTGIAGLDRGVEQARRRRARLRCLGNGVVAEQAAAAFVTLAQRAGLVSDVLVERAEAVHHA